VIKNAKKLLFSRLSCESCKDQRSQRSAKVKFENLPVIIVDAEATTQVVLNEKQ
jgi:hypothetical protein